MAHPNAVAVVFRYAQTRTEPWSVLARATVLARIGPYWCILRRIGAESYWLVRKAGAEQSRLAASSSSQRDLQKAAIHPQSEDTFCWRNAQV